jgi:uncharacterized damage-inducible protein DinB
MDQDKFLRDELIFHLTKGHAHMTIEEAIADFPEDKMNAQFTNGEYTFWHLLEHIRRTQKDILNFITNPDYKEPEWPKDYWPPKDKKAETEDWQKTIAEFLKDREALKKLVEDREIDLYAKIPHGTGQTLAREILVVTDHNAYHIGEFSIMRQVLNTWKK